MDLGPSEPSDIAANGASFCAALMMSYPYVSLDASLTGSSAVRQPKGLMNPSGSASNFLLMDLLESLAAAPRL